MIVLRRIVAVFLAVVLVILFIPVLVVYRVNSTVGNPGFYIDQLRRADVYNFIDSDLLPAALQNVQLGPTGSPVNLSALKPQLMAVAQQTVPPQWLQAQTEQVINMVVPYVMGSTPTFRISVPLKDRVQAATVAIKSTLHQEGVFTRIYDQAIESVALNPPQGLPVTLTASEMKSMLRTVVPPDWVLKQLDNALDEAVPYFIKDKEHFTIRVNFLERLDALKSVVVDILSRPEAYDAIIGEIMVKPLTQNLGQATQFGVTVTSQEIVTVLKQALPITWYRSLVTSIVDQISAYLSGTRPTLSVTISLADRKSAIAQTLGQFFDQKLEAVYNSLPLATPVQVIQWLANPSTTLPPFRLPGMSYSDIKRLLNIDLAGTVAGLISKNMPDQFTLSEADLSSSLGSGSLVQLRDWVQKGFTYTDQDISQSMGATQLDNVRQYLAGGFTFTEKDLSNLTQGGGALNTVRSAMSTARGVLTFAWLIPLLLLVAVGFLGGRGWGSRLVWAAAALGVAAVIALIVFGPVFSSLVQAPINAALKPPAGDALQAMLAAKGVTVAQNALGTFIGGLRIQAIIFLVAALGLVALGYIWERRQGEASSET